MLRNFLKNKKAQNTAEYALLIALVVAGIIAMQTYAQRALQARIHDVSLYMANSTSTDANGNSIGDTNQYEPYYLSSDYSSQANSSDVTQLGQGVVGYESNAQNLRNGVQVSNYDTTDTGMNQ